MHSLLLTLLLTSFSNLPEELPYHQLVWSDFLASKPIGKDAIAETRTRLKMDISEEDDKATYSVYAVFLPYESFTATDREDILRHEQTHLNISALIAKECMRAISKYQNKSISYEAKVDRILDHYSKAIDTLNACFDRDTHGGQHPVIEAAWEKQIQSDLNKLQ